jgi:hypothetical protein
MLTVNPKTLWGGKTCHNAKCVLGKNVCLYDRENHYIHTHKKKYIIA